MKNFYQRCFLLLAGLLLCMTATAQEDIPLKGRVCDAASSEPIIGATVQIKGLTVGTATSVSGDFELRIEEYPATLCISSIGYKTREVVVNTPANPLNILLEEESQVLNDVVVVAYGTMKKSDLTGSVTSVSAKEINSMPVMGLDKAIQGKVPGVQVKTASASPGGGMSVIIRGGNSLMSGLDPLYVVDGFPMEKSAMSSFSSDDVESVEVLKDASATALYGSRAANGVILITTKKGKKGKTRVEYSNYFNFQKVYKDLDLLNGQEFASMYNEYLENIGQAPLYTGDNRYFPSPEQIGKGTDWFRQITRTGFEQNHQLTISGAGEKASYMFSANFHDHDGVILGGQFRRYALRSNNDLKVNSWLKFTNSISLGRTNLSGSGDNTDFQKTDGTIANMIKMSPALPVYDINGNYTENNFPGANSKENPVAIAREVQNDNEVDNLVENLSINITPVKGLSLTSRLGASVRNSRQDHYTPRTTVTGGDVNGRASISTSNQTTLLNENILTYDPTLHNTKHRLSAMVGYSIQRTTNKRAGLSASNFPSDIFGSNNMGSATDHDPGTSWKTASQLVSYLYRLNYVYDDRFLFTVTGRADGSSRFSKDNRWGFFPSVAAAWNIYNEKFLKNVEWLSNFKLRTSWGVTGNQNIGLYKSLSLLSINKYAFSDMVVNGIVISALADPNLKWETTSQFNAAVDLGFFNNRLTLTAEYYFKNTEDLLLNQKLPSTSGYTSMLTNVGELQNQGFEFSVWAMPVDCNGFKLRLNGSISLNRSKLKKLNTESGELWMDDIFMKEGYPIGLFRGKDYMGIFKSQEEIDSYVDPRTGKKIMPGAQPGDVKYRDVNGDGIISGEDWVILGSSTPDFIWDFGGEFQYKRLSLGFHFIGSHGNCIKNASSTYYQQVTNVRSNLSRKVLDRWHPTLNPDGDFMKLGGIGSMPDVEDGSFIKLQNIRLSYAFRFPKAGIEELSLFFSAQNVFTITDYSGFDPDINTSGGSNVNFGTDNASFPNPRVFSLGCTLKF